MKHGSRLVTYKNVTTARETVNMKFRGKHKEDENKLYKARNFLCV